MRNLRTAMSGAVLFFIGLAPAAHAAIVTWNVSGTFDDGGTLTGSFDFDASTTTISNWNLTTAGGVVANFPDFTYSVSTSTSGYNGFNFPEMQLVFYDNSSTRRLILSTTSALTDLGGTVPLIEFIDGTNFSGECDNCTPSRYLGGDLVSGEADVSTPAPEPATGGVIAAAILAARFYRRRLR